MLLSRGVHAAAVSVDEIFVEGAKVARTDRVRIGPPRAEAAARMLSAGDAFDAGTRFVVPAAVIVKLQSGNNAIITLFPDTDYVVQAVLPNGEVHSVSAGAARFSLNSVFNFFNVDLHAYVARVWGTEFDVDTDVSGNVHVNLAHGTVACARNARVRADDRWIATESTDVLTEQGLRAVTYSPDAGDYLRRFDSYADAQAYYRAQLDEAISLGNADQILGARNNLGQTLLTLGKIDAAGDTFLAGLALAEQRADLPWAARLLNNLAAVDITAQAFDSALRFAERALAINLKLYPHGIQRRIVHNQMNRALALRRLGREDEALGALNEALRIALQLDADGNSADVAGIYETLGSMTLDKSPANPTHGLAWLERALAIRLQLFGGHAHPDVVQSLNSLGVAYRKLKNPEMALEYHQQALAQRQALFGARPHPRVADSWINVGNAQFELTDYRAALASYDSALAIERQLAPKGPRLADTYSRLASTWSALGDAAQQARYERLAREAVQIP